MPLIGNVLEPLAKTVLIPLGLTAAASAKDATIHKRIFRSGPTTLINPNEKMKDIMKIVKCLEDSGLLIKGISETTFNEAKEQKRRIYFNVRERTVSMQEGGDVRLRVLQIFEKTFRSPGDQRPKYFMAQ